MANTNNLIHDLQFHSINFHKLLASARDHQHRFGRLLAEALNGAMGTRFVLGWEIGNYDDPLCITIIHSPIQGDLDPTSDTGIYLSDAVESVLKELGIKPIPLYFEDNALLPEQEAERIASQLRNYLLGSGGQTTPESE
jgi:hypothetical protein